MESDEFIVDLVLGHLRVSSAECRCGARFTPQGRAYAQHLVGVLRAAGCLRRIP